MAETKKFCIHSDGLGYCDILSDDTVRHYCVEGPCPHEIIVEYEPVKHGRWIMRGGKLYCSACQQRAGVARDSDDFWYTKGTACCPNCGAKMEVDNG